MKIPVIKGNFLRGWAFHTAGKCPKEKLFVMGGNLEMLALKSKIWNLKSKI